MVIHYTLVFAKNVKIQIAKNVISIIHVVTSVIQDTLKMEDLALAAMNSTIMDHVYNAILANFVMNAKRVID